MHYEDLEFQSITHGVLLLSEVAQNIKEYLERDENAEYSLLIGTDSHEKRKDLKDESEIQLVSAILLYKKGHGGKYFWHKKRAQKIYSLREKIYAETMASLDLAAVFVPFLQKTLNGKRVDYDLEIHVDVGEHGATRTMIKEIVGMVTGNGYVAKTKPESFAATYVADKHT